jgi:hypothetical protein
MMADGMGGQTQRPWKIAAVDGPEHRGDEDVVLRRVALFASGQRPRPRR